MDRFQVNIRALKEVTLSAPRVMGVIHMSTYVIYEACREDADKHTCVCEIGDLEERIPKEEERKDMACKLEKCE